MKKIQNFSPGRLRVAEFFGFMERVVAYTETLTGDAEKSVVTAFTASVTALDEALKASSGSALSAAVTEADELADTAWRAINAIAKVQTENPAEAVRGAAEEVAAVWRKYGDVTSMAYDEEYGNLHNALQDFTTLGAAKQALVHVDDWVTELQTRYDEFTAARKARDAEQGAKVSGIVKQRRQEADDAYRSLTAAVNALVILNGETAYATFIDNVNVAIDESKAKLSARSTRSAKQGSADTATGETAG